MSAFFTEEKREKIESYLRLLVSSKHNLTAIKSLDEAYQKHFLDVFLPLKEFSLKGNFIDIGTGGGVPGIICFFLKVNGHCLIPSERRYKKLITSSINWA